MNTIRLSNSLDPDQAGHFVGPDLGLNCLQRLSADDRRRQSIQELFTTSKNPTLPLALFILMIFPYILIHTTGKYLFILYFKGSQIECFNLRYFCHRRHSLALNYFILLSCQPRVTVTSCFVYKVNRDLESIYHLRINPILR